MYVILAGLMALALGQNADGAARDHTPQGVTPKIGFVDFARLLEEYPKSLDRQAELQRQREQAENVASGARSAVERLSDELQLLRKDSDAYFAKREDMMRATASLQLAKERTEALLIQREAEINAEVFRDIRSAIERYARENGYVSVFKLERDPSALADPEIQAYRMNTMLLFYSDPEADVTVGVLELLNREYGRTSMKAPVRRAVPVDPPPTAPQLINTGPARPSSDSQDPPSVFGGDGEEPSAAALPAAEVFSASSGASDDPAALLRELLAQNQRLHERIAKLETALDSNLVALADRVGEVERHASAAPGYSPARATQVTGSVEGRMLWSGHPVSKCKVKLVRMPAGNTLDAMTSLFDIGVRPDRRRMEFVEATDDNGVYRFEEIPIGPYKLQWQPAESRSWVRRIRKKPDVIVEAGMLAYCGDVETNIRAVN